MTVGPSATVRQVAKILLERHISAVPVVDADNPIVNKQGHLVGIASRANLLQAVATARPKLEISLSNSTIRKKFLEETRSSHGHTPSI